MHDIHHQLTIAGSQHDVFQAVSTSAGLDRWWTKRSSGEPVPGNEYELFFGPGFDWRAIVSRASDTEFELAITKADEDWTGTRVGFTLQNNDGVVTVTFHHNGWPQLNDHFSRSSYCWAMYLRGLKRYVERGEVTPYDNRGA